MERGIRATNTKDLPAKENSSSLKFQQAFTELSVNGICIPGLALDIEREVPSQGGLAEMSDDV